MDTIIILTIFALSGCMFLTPPSLKPGASQPDPLVRALAPLEKGDEAKAVGELKKLLDDEALQCRAAFYLYALDGSKKEYIAVIQSKECEDELMPELRLINRLNHRPNRDKYYKKQLQTCQKELKSKDTLIEKLQKELEELEAENSRLLFELKKMEEIRRETEKWRLK